MEQKRNYQRELDKLIKTWQNDGIVPRILLHSCCAPCSSYCMEYLRQYAKLTILYYNPNITSGQEYEKRKLEEQRLIEIYNQMDAEGVHCIEMMDADYDPERFLELSKGYEECPEGGERCARCFDLRLRYTAQLAARNQFDYFATTLTISPLKNAELINQIGASIGAEYEIAYLASDFKKKDGYKRSIELSAIYDLYRQDFCGCAFSKAQRMNEKKKNDGFNIERENREDGKDN